MAVHCSRRAPTGRLLLERVWGDHSFEPKFSKERRHSLPICWFPGLQHITCTVCVMIPDTLKKYSIIPALNLLLQQFTGYLYSFSGSQNYQLLCELPQSHKIWSPVEAGFPLHSSLRKFNYTGFIPVTFRGGCTSGSWYGWIYFFTPTLKIFLFLGTNTKVKFLLLGLKR